jgi:hypothetical protein
MRYLAIFFALACSAVAQTAPSGTNWKLVNTGTDMQTMYGQKIFSATGSQDTPLVGESTSGASAGVFTQSVNFTSPTLTITRTGVSGGSIATGPIIFAQGQQESTANTPILEAGACLAVSGDNYVITWGDASASISGGVMDGTGYAKGKLSVDPVHRQLVAEDGITPVLTWTGGSIQCANFAVSNLSGYPNNSSQYLAGNATWQVLPTVTAFNSILVSGSCTIHNAGLSGHHGWVQSTGTNALGLVITGTNAVVKSSAGTSDTSAFTLFFTNY